MIAPWNQTEISADVTRSAEPSGIVNCGCEGEGGELANTGNAISRRQEPDTLAIFLMSPSIATTGGEDGGTRRNQTPHRSRQAGMPSLACSAYLMKVELSARGSRIPNTTARPRIWFSRVTRWPTSFLRAMISERTACAGRDFT
jgi:hypothetical protein